MKKSMIGRRMEVRLAQSRADKARNEADTQLAAERVKMAAEMVRKAAEKVGQIRDSRVYPEIKLMVK